MAVPPRGPIARPSAASSSRTAAVIERRRPSRSASAGERASLARPFLVGDDGAHRFLQTGLEASGGLLRSPLSNGRLGLRRTAPTIDLALDLGQPLGFEARDLAELDVVPAGPPQRHLEKGALQPSILGRLRHAPQPTHDGGIDVVARRKRFDEFGQDLPARRLDLPQGAAQGAHVGHDVVRRPQVEVVPHLAESLARSEETSPSEGERSLRAFDRHQGDEADGGIGDVDPQVVGVSDEVGNETFDRFLGCARYRVSARSVADVDPDQPSNRLPGYVRPSLSRCDLRARRPGRRGRL